MLGIITMKLILYFNSLICLKHNLLAKKNIKTFPNKEFLKKCHNGYIVDTYKYQEKYNEELNECFNDTENIKMQQQEGNGYIMCNH